MVVVDQQPEGIPEGTPQQSPRNQRRLVGLLVTLVLSLITLTKGSIGSAQELATMLDEEAEASKLGQDDVEFPKKDNKLTNGEEEPLQTSREPSQAPATLPPTAAPIEEEDSGDVDGVDETCPPLEAGKTSIETMVDASKSVDEDPDANKIILDHAHELWSFLAAGMPTTTDEDKATACRKERWRKAVKIVTPSEDDDIQSYRSVCCNVSPEDVSKANQFKSKLPGTLGPYTLCPSGQKPMNSVLEMFFATRFTAGCNRAFGMRADIWKKEHGNAIDYEYTLQIPFLRQFDWVIGSKLNGNWDVAFPLSKANNMQVQNLTPRLVFIKNKEIRGIGSSGTFQHIEDAILEANGGLEYSIYLGHEDGTPFNPDTDSIEDQLKGMTKLRNLFVEQSPLAAQTLANPAKTNVVPVPIAACTREILTYSPALLELAAYPVPFDEREMKAYVSFGEHKDRPSRTAAWVEIRARPDDFVAPDPNNFVYVPTWQMWKGFASHAFVLSPFGNGMDCFRTYEILLMGAIAILPSRDTEGRKFAARDTYVGLPVVVVDDWAEVNGENMQKWAKELGPLAKDRKEVLRRLSPQFQAKKIRDGYGPVECDISS